MESFSDIDNDVEYEETCGGCELFEDDFGPAKPVVPNAKTITELVLHDSYGRPIATAFPEKHEELNAVRGDDKLPSHTHTANEKSEMLGPLQLLVSEQHYAMNPYNGKIEPTGNKASLVWSSTDQEIKDRGWHFGVNPYNGNVEKMPNEKVMVYTSQEREINERGWLYGINPTTGAIEKQPIKEQLQRKR